MSYAWKQLRLAVTVLAGTGPQRERLIHAYTKLIDLKQKDLPAEIRISFAELTQNIVLYPTQDVHGIVRSKVDSLDDGEIGSIIHSIIDMYDAVTRYQPMISPDARECRC